MQDDKTQVAAAVKELFPLIAKPLPKEREQITEDLSRIIYRFKPFLLKKLETIALEGGEHFSSDEDREWVSREYEEPGVRLTENVYLLSSGDFLEVKAPEIIEHEGISENHLWSHTRWRRPPPKKVGIYAVSTPEVLTGIKWLVLEHFLELDEKDLSTLRPFSKEFIQFVLAGWLEKEIQRDQDMERLILLKIGRESVPILAEAIVDKHLDPVKKAHIAELLGEMQDPRAIDPLFQVLKENLGSAAGAIEKIAGKDLSFPDEDSKIAFLMNRPMEREIIDSLLPYADNDRVARRLLNYVLDGSPEEKHYIVSKFVERGDYRVIEPLAEIMARDSERARDRSRYERVKVEERKVAAKLLGDIGGKEAERILIDAVLNDSKEVRQSARDALIKIGSPSIIEPLTKGIDLKKNKYKKTLNKVAYKQSLPEFDEAYEVLRAIDKRPRTFLDNLLGRRKY